MPMQLRRAIVVIVSVVFGAAVTWAIVYLRFPLGPVTFGFGTDFERFAYSNVGLVFISLAAIAWIWLDYFLETKFLKS